MNNYLFILGILVAVAVPQSAWASVELRVSVGSTNRKIVVFEEGVSVEEQQQVLAASSDQTQVISSMSSIQATVIHTTGDQAKVEQKLLATGKIKRIDDDVEAYALGHRAVAQSLPWGVQRIAAPTAWLRSSGSGARVGLIDSGIDLDHPDLASNLRGGVNTISPTRSADDDNGHGTHVAGILAAVNNTTGVVGVAPDAQLFPIKVLDRRGRGYISDIVEGIDWAVANGMNVINMSLGTSEDIPSLHEAIDRATRAGVLVVAAAGNSGGEVLYPARYDGVLAVGMVDQDAALHRSSSRGAALDVVAPGVGVNSTYKGGRYREMTGTSMASPHVAGIAALLRSAPQYCDTNGDAQCTPAELTSRVMSAASDLGTPGRDDLFGAGLVSASRVFGL